MDFSTESRPQVLGALDPLAVPYHPLFESLQLHRGSMTYHGDLDGVLSQCQRAMAGKVAVGWFPQLALRGIIEGTLAMPDTTKRAEVVSLATQFALEAYAGCNTATTSLNTLHASLEAADVSYGTRVSQGDDKVTREATYHEKSFDSSIDVMVDYDERPILMIALGHGGLVASMQTAIYLTQDQGVDTVVYPVRFSRRKSGDMYPVVVESEIDHLRTVGRNRQVIVYDEDISFGRTIKKATTFFEQKLEVEVGGYANAYYNTVELG
jgi:hypothetical protein